MAPNRQTTTSRAKRPATPARPTVKQTKPKTPEKVTAARKPKAQPAASASRKRKATTAEAHGDEGLPTPAQQARPAKKAKSARAVRKDAPSAEINNRATEPATVFVFGGGENGELGLGPKVTASLRPRKNPFLDPSQDKSLQITDIACGGMHTVALTVDNRLVTWGVNDNEALGRDTQWDGGLRDVDEESDEDGELNPHESTPTAIDSRYFGEGVKLVSVAAGDSCSFALTSTGQVYGWGTFRDPEGKESFCYSSTGAAIKKQARPMLIPGLEKITQLACGANHVLALDKAGNIWGLGSGHQNQFGRRLFGRHQDTLKPQVVRVCRGSAKYIACGEYHCFAVDKKGNVWGWGLNSFGEAGDVKTAGSDAALLPQPVKIPTLSGKDVAVLAGGAHHSAAVTTDGDCLVWGRLDGGQLGLEFSEEQIADDKIIRCDERGKPRICLVPTAVSRLGKVVHVACGTDHTVFVASNGSAFSTGFGSEGQLGLGTEDDAEVAQKIAGKQAKDYVLKWAGAGGQFSILTGKPAAK